MGLIYSNGVMQIIFDTCNVLMQDKACEQVDYEVQSSSGSEQGEEEEEEEEEEGVCGRELREGGDEGSEMEEEEDLERQQELAIVEKEKVCYCCVRGWVIDCCVCYFVG